MIRVTCLSTKADSCFIIRIINLYKAQFLQNFTSRKKVIYNSCNSCLKIRVIDLLRFKFDFVY